MGPEGGEGGVRCPEYPYPINTLSPGKVVWAKVEGHEWWPAKVVRRRAVPREVRRQHATSSAALSPPPSALRRHILIHQCHSASALRQHNLISVISIVIMRVGP